VTQDNGGADIVNNFYYDTNTSSHLQMISEDGRGNQTIHEFESFGRPSQEHRVKETTEDGVVTTFNRDVMGRIKTIKRSGVTRRYYYDSNKLLDYEVHPENGTTYYDYYNNGWLSKATNNGRDITYFYESDGQLTFVEFSGQSQYASRDYGYDSYGNLNFLKSISGSEVGEHTYSYNSENALESESLLIDGRSFSIAYGRDSLSNIKSITYPSGRTYSLTPDYFGYPTKIVEDGGKSIYSSIEYHPTGTYKQLNRGSHRVETTLDQARRSYTRSIIRNNNGIKFGDQQYLYDQASNLNKINDYRLARYTSMQYDQQNRLKQVSISDDEENGNWLFKYDDHDDIETVSHAGDMTTYNYNNNNKRLTSMTSNSPTRNFQYDARGNMTGIDMLLDNALITRQLTRNAADQIIGINNGTTYAYDGHGRRMKKGTNTGAIYTLYDIEGNLLYREDTGFGIKSDYFYVSGDLVARRDSSQAE